MPGLAEEIAKHEQRAGPNCSMKAMMESLDEEDQKAVDSALRRWPLVQDTAVARALQARGIEIGPETVARHRRRLTNTPGDHCKCQV